MTLCFMRFKYLNHMKQPTQGIDHFSQSIKDISTATGLTYHYITKCRNRLPEVFSGTYIQDPDQGNAYFFNSDALSYFRQIAHHHKSGKTLTYIKKVLREELGVFNKNRQPAQSPVKSIEESTKEPLKGVQKVGEEALLTSELTALKLELSLSKEIGKKEVQIAELTGKLATAEASLRLLGAPTTAEGLERLSFEKSREKRASYINSRIMEVIEELSNLDNQFFVGRKRKRLARKLAALKKEREMLYKE